MDTLDALIRLHRATGNTAWLRAALMPGAEAARAIPSAGFTGTPGEPPLPAPASPAALLHESEAAWRRRGAPAGLRRLTEDAEAAAAVDAVRRWLAGGRDRHAIGWDDPAYPSLLREAPSPPLLLFVEGQPERLWWPQVAVVGSRSPTPAGRERAGRWARAFADAGYVVTSGLASGIDAAAHGAALASPGTIAVTATGPDRCFPTAHRSLHAAIVRDGAIATEHPPGTPARREHFPRRNRIIAGLALATVVVEAAERSGALITARLAAEAGRDVFALPGAPENLKARGCHRLIRDGAALVDDPAQVLEAIGAASGRVGASLRQRLDLAERRMPAGGAPSRRGDDPVSRDLFDGDEAVHARVDAALGRDGARFDELLARSGLTPATLAPILLAMELEGRLTQQHGVYLPCGSAPPTRAGLQRRR